MSHPRWRNCARYHSKNGNWQPKPIRSTCSFLLGSGKLLFRCQDSRFVDDRPVSSTSCTPVEWDRTSTSSDIQPWESCGWPMSYSFLSSALCSCCQPWLNLCLQCSVALYCRISTSSTRTSRIRRRLQRIWRDVLSHTDVVTIPKLGESTRFVEDFVWGLFVSDRSLSSSLTFSKDVSYSGSITHKRKYTTQLHTQTHVNVFLLIFILMILLICEKNGNFKYENSHI